MDRVERNKLLASPVRLNDLISHAKRFGAKRVGGKTLPPSRIDSAVRDAADEVFRIVTVRSSDSICAENHLQSRNSSQPALSEIVIHRQNLFHRRKTLERLWKEGRPNILLLKLR